MRKQAPSPFGYKNKAFYDAIRGHKFDVADATATHGSGLEYEEAAKLLHRHPGALIYFSDAAAPPAAVAAAPSPAPSPTPAVAPTGGLGVSYAIDAPGESTIPAAGVIGSLGAMLQLYVNGAQSPVPCRVNAGDKVEARSVDPQIAAAQAAARAAVTPLIQSSAPRYHDVTVKPAVPRTAPPPKDVTASSDVFVRLGAPPAAEAQPPLSPLAPDLDDLPDLSGGGGAADLPDVLDLVGDLGGSPTDADLAHAKAQAEAAAKAG